MIESFRGIGCAESFWLMVFIRFWAHNSNFRRIIDILRLKRGSMEGLYSRLMAKGGYQRLIWKDSMKM